MYDEKLLEFGYKLEPEDVLQCLKCRIHYDVRFYDLTDTPCSACDEHLTLWCPCGESYDEWAYMTTHSVEDLYKNTFG